MEDIFVALGEATRLRQEAQYELMVIDSGPEGEGSPMLAEKLLADAATKLAEVVGAIVQEATRLAQRREKLTRDHPASFATTPEGS